MSWLTRVEDLIGSVSDTGAVTQWLKDGAWDVINRVKKIDPSMLPLFAKITEGVGNDAAIGNNLLLGVYRTDSGTESEYREVPASFKYKIENSDSLYEASTSDPVFYRENGRIYLRPRGGDNDMSLVTIDTTNLVHGGSGADYFPEDMEYLIALYAAIQVLQRAMADTSMPSNVVDLVLPALPDDADVDFSGVPTAPSFVGPTLSLSTLSPISDLTLSAVPPATPSLTSVTFTSINSAVDASAPVFSTATVSAADVYTGSAPTFTSPVMVAPNWSDTESWITDEDAEMLGARIATIQGQVAEYSAKLQESQAQFNKENAIYQSAMQESMQEVQIANQVNLARAQADLQIAIRNKDKDQERQLGNAMQDMTAIVQNNGNLIALYQAESGQYQIKVNTEIQTFTGNFQKNIQVFQQESQVFLTEYASDVQKETARIAPEIQEYQQEIAKAVQKYQAETGYDLSKYSAEIQSIIGKFTNDIQNYTSNIQKTGVEYQWLQEQYMRLKQQYEQGFVPFQAQQPQRQEQRR